MATSIFELVDALPQSSMTTRLLSALDWVVPGQWQNVVGFENTIRHVTGESDQALIQQIGERAIQLYNDPSQGYQRAAWLYQTIDSLQGKAGGLSLLNKVGESVGFLGFLSRITPKAETVQTIDLSLKTIVELLAFCQINGLPGDSIGDFVESLADYRDEALMRMAALVCVDGLVPLGPEFIQSALTRLQGMGAGDLEKNERFQQIRSLIPGGNAAGQLGFIQQAVSGVSGWMSSFVADRNLSPDRVVSSLAGFMDGVEGKMDYVASFLDMTTSYYEHTGIQSLARSLINRAVGEI
jgi:hypothetical protein